MTVRVSCVGVGHWGPNLVRNFAAHPDARVETVCDLSEERLALVRRNVPGIARTTTQPAEALEGADAIVISTPTSTHYALAKAAVEAGKHVLVEKPLCRTVEQGEELLDLAQRKGVVLAVGHVFLFNNGIRAMAKAIREPSFGRVYYVYSERTNLGPIRTDVNALWDLAAHDLSILDSWLGAEPVAVTARGQSYLNRGVEDVVLASFTYPGDVLASVHASWLNPRKVREITVVGEHRMAVWNDMDLAEPVRIYDKTVDPPRRGDYADSFGAFRMLVRNGDVRIPHIAGPEPLAAECSHFLDCVLGRATPINGGAGALSVVRSLEAADRSMREGSLLVTIGGAVTA
jgi:predicted dehydrogenase